MERVHNPATQSKIPDDLISRISDLSRIGIALSKEKNLDRLLEEILLESKKITNSDGGTLYRRSTQNSNNLQFAIFRTDSLNIAMGGTIGTAIPFAPLQLRDENGRENTRMVAAYSVLKDRTVAISDAYEEQGFDFSGTKNFDKLTGYRSRSFLTVPMKNHDEEIIGVLQLINAKDRTTGEIIPFNKTDISLVESLASQAAMALTNRQLVIQLENCSNLSSIYSIRRSTKNRRILPVTAPGCQF
jgi:GAF domain-containing protein